MLKIETHIAGHQIDAYGKKVYIDNILATDGDKVRPDKPYEFWEEFLMNHDDFNPMCLFTNGCGGRVKTFEELYES